MPSEYIITCLDFLRAVTHHRLKHHFGQPAEDVMPQLEPPPDNDETSFAKFVRHIGPSQHDMIIILCAFAPHISPGFFDRIILEYLPHGGDFPEFGGAKGEVHRGTLPTGETALFLIAGINPAMRLSCLSLFGTDHFLVHNKILWLGSVKAGEPALSGRLLLDPELVEVFLTGKVALPKLSIHFPAQHLSTQMDWDDLVLKEQTADHIHDLQIWIQHQQTLMGEWGMSKKIKPGYRALFYGPPGTGKTLTATLLGKTTGRDVFRIDLSMVVSKYIGETEKNLASLFDKAEHKNWILFFDEADSIFGKRTGVRDAHDKYANQEVSYLLQRIESFSGLTILATNFKNNIDVAFIRRFNSIVYFPRPDAQERLKLWEKSFPTSVQFEPDVNLEEIAEQYELTGSQILNVVQHSCLHLLHRQGCKLKRGEIISGIKKELAKEGK